MADKPLPLLLSFVRNLGRRFPNHKVWAEKVINPSQDLNALRREIWNKRLEFWARKAHGYPQVIQAAKGEFCTVMGKLRRPGEVTYRDIATIAVGGVQVYGCFCIGEMWGRQNVFGYAVGPLKEYHEGLL